MTAANNMLGQIDGAIAPNNWRELKTELERGPEHAHTVATF